MKKSNSKFDQKRNFISVIDKIAVRVEAFLKLHINLRRIMIVSLALVLLVAASGTKLMGSGAASKNSQSNLRQSSTDSEKDNFENKKSLSKSALDEINTPRKNNINKISNNSSRLKQIICSTQDQFSPKAVLLTNAGSSDEINNLVQNDENSASSALNTSGINDKSEISESTSETVQTSGPAENTDANSVPANNSSASLSTSSSSTPPAAQEAFVIPVSPDHVEMYVQFVAAECGQDWSYDGCLMVAQVFINRALNGRWGDLYGVMTAPNQFSVYPYYYKEVTPTENQRKAAMDALRGKTIFGRDVMFFCLDYINTPDSWWSTLTPRGSYDNTLFFA